MAYEPACKYIPLYFTNPEVDVLSKNLTAFGKLQT